VKFLTLHPVKPKGKPAWPRGICDDHPDIHAVTGRTTFLVTMGNPDFTQSFAGPKGAALFGQMNLLAVSGQKQALLSPGYTH